jgi:hypothetical protein
MKDRIPAGNPTGRVGAHDRLFYGGMAALMALTVVAGFAPTYYARFFAGGPRATMSGAPFTFLVHVHGALFTAWVLLFIVQTGLVATRRVSVHRRLGMAGAALAAAMVAAGFSLAVVTAARGSAPPGIDPLAFLAIPVFDMILFASFVIAALLRRRDPEAHKRLMLLAYISIIVAAIARLPGILPLGPPGFFGLAIVLVLVAATYDLVSRRKVHRVYLWGGALFAISVPLRLAISGTAVWRTLAMLLTKQASSIPG